MTNTIIFGILIIHTLLLLFLLWKSISQSQKVKTKSFELGDFEVTTENGELSIKPKK